MLEIEEVARANGFYGVASQVVIDCTRVEEVPISTGMKKLEFVSANRCRHLRDIPPSIGSLENLKKLHLGGCVNLEPLTRLPSSLGSLTVEVSSKLTLPNLANLVNLKELSWRGHFELKDDCLSGLGELEKFHLRSVKICT